jgi:hypothetical protein
MADTKISALPAATTPLAGTEVLPIVQGGTTDKVSVANLTAGRAISATQLTLTTGSLIVASGQGVDFSATPGTGTNELFNDYEEGTWTPAQGSGCVVVGTFSSSGTYTKIGRSVTVTGIMFGSTTIACTAGTQFTSNLPFANSPDGPLGQAMTENTGVYCPIYTSGVQVFTANTPLGPTKYILFSLTYITA